MSTLTIRLPDTKTSEAQGFCARSGRESEQTCGGMGHRSTCAA
jgi:hypothetical protein